MTDAGTGPQPQGEAGTGAGGSGGPLEVPQLLDPAEDGLPVPDRSRHGGMPVLDDDELALLAARERVAAGLQDYVPEDVPPAAGAAAGGLVRGGRPRPTGPAGRRATALTTSEDSTRPHLAWRAEERLQVVLDRRLRARGWTPRVTPFIGYGADGWVRVLARVVLTSPQWRPGRDGDGRGWRRFLCASATGVDVEVSVGGQSHRVTTGRDGYLDVRLPASLDTGWASVRLSVNGSEPLEAPVRIVAPGPQAGLLSDIDDTVMVTMLPRPLIALRNAFLLREGARQPVPGMSELYADIVRERPGIVVVYLSTGAWNTAGALRDFLSRNGYPPGPLLLTDWGPTQTGWFRSGRTHKREQLRRLYTELPQVRWLLVGDDGQHDPSIYAEAAAASPDQVLGVAIRQLSATEQVIRTGTPRPRESVPDLTAPDGRRPMTARDGFGLREQLRDRHLLL